MTKTSDLRKIIENVYTAKTSEEAKKIMVDHLNSTDCTIAAHQKRVMLIQVGRCETLVAVQRYATNSFLRFEGMRSR